MALATDVSRLALLDAPPEVERRLGTVISDTYRISEHLGSGGSSHVFAADHTRLGKRFAVKILRSELAASDRASLRFRREATAVARLQHEHIVSVIDCGELDDRTPFLVMELLEGEDLRTLLRREGLLPTRRAVELVLQACRALTAVHEAGLIHRDLKPENLFITRRSTGEDWCKVLDFGVAKLDAGLTTAQDTLIGTVRYMAPEQLSDSRSVEAATDVYALAAILYECLTGAPLYDARSEPELMYQIMNREPTPLLERCPHLPPALAQAVERAIAKDLARRPQSTGKFAAALEHALKPEVHHASDLTLSEGGRPLRHARRLPAFLRTAAIPLAVVGAGFILALSALAMLNAARSRAPIRVAPVVASSIGRATLSAADAQPAPGVASAVVLFDRERSASPASDVTTPRAARPPARSNAPSSPRNVTPDGRKPTAGRVGGFDATNPYGNDE